MDEDLRHIIDDLDVYAAATTNLRDELTRLEQWNADDRARLLSGVTIEESMKVVDSAARSRNLTRLLDEFEQARRELRAWVTSAMLGHGVTVAEVGDAFGVSRQLANRFARDMQRRGT